MAMAETKQLGARLPKDIAELAGQRASDLNVSIGEYLAGLVRADAEGLRQRAMASAERFLAEHQGLFDEAEDGEESSGKRVRAA